MATPNPVDCEPTHRPGSPSPEAARHEAVLARRREGLCPPWLAFVLTSPLRRWFDDPVRLLAPFVGPSDLVLELGPGPGFFTIPMAERVGAHGKVVCVDIQQAMLSRLRKRVDARGMGERVETRCCSAQSLGLNDMKGRFDKAVLLWVLHEVPNPQKTLEEVYAALKPGGRLLLVEPSGHCPADLFAAEGWVATQVGFSAGGVEPWEALRKRQAAIYTK